MNAILGVNHQFLYPGAITNAPTHTKTLASAAKLTNVEALDCWLWPEKARAAEEARILLDSGKRINYNVGDRYLEKPVFPASSDAHERAYAKDVLKREIDFALLVNSKTLVIGSGPDVPEDREAALERFTEFAVSIAAVLPQDVTFAIEPTDQDVDKRFLLGPPQLAAEVILNLREMGYPNAGMLLDMGHIPIMHETLESAVNNSKRVLKHVHMGNCVYMKAPQSPYYGDKHVAWGYPGGEYGEAEAREYIRLLIDIGYFTSPEATASFEMRPIEGLSPEDSLNEFVRIWSESFGARAN